MLGILKAFSSTAQSHKACGQPPRSVHGKGVVSLGREEAWPALVSDAGRPLGYTRNMRTVKVLTGALSSSVALVVVSASAVLPGSCEIGGLICGTGGVTRVDGPASVFLYRVGRVRDTPYGWYHPVRIIPVVVGSVLGQWEVFTSCGKVSTRLCRDD